MRAILAALPMRDVMAWCELVIRGVDEDLFARLRAASAAAGESVDETAIRLLREGLRVEGRVERFRRYVTWTEQDAREFDAALRAQRAVDPEAWASAG